LRTENILDSKLEIQFGKTNNARRRIPMTPRVKAVLEMRLSAVSGSEWVFPADTRSGHIEPSSLKKRHATAIVEGARILREATRDANRELVTFELYNLKAHLPDSMGASHGPMDAGLSSRPS